MPEESLLPGSPSVLYQMDHHVFSVLRAEYSWHLSSQASRPLQRLTRFVLPGAQSLTLTALLLSHRTEKELGQNHSPKLSQQKVIVQKRSSCYYFYTFTAVLLQVEYSTESCDAREVDVFSVSCRVAAQASPQLQNLI